MRISLFLFLIAFLFLISCGTVTPLNNNTTKGDTATIRGIKVLYLSGNHRDRGFQHGYLLGNSVMQSFHDILISYMCKDNDSLYGAARTFIRDNFVFEEGYRQEAQGVISGMKNANVSLYDSTLKRSIDSLDILMLSSIEELYNIIDFKGGCSSISTWGESTKQDSILQGDLVITRHWDYPKIPTMINNLMIIVHKPTESSENNWINISWAGMIGSCSAMNERGLGAFLDYDDYLHELTPNLSTHHPVALSIRNSIEQKDFNGDGKHTFRDLLDAIKQYTPYFGSSIHFVTPQKDDSCAAIIESNNILGVAFRTKHDNTDIQGDYCAVTNHFRVLKPPATCIRYQKILDSLQVSPLVGYDRSWILLSGAGATPTCVYSLSFVPAKRTLRLAFASVLEPGVPAYDRQSVYFSWGDLFNK